MHALTILVQLIPFYAARGGGPAQAVAQAGTATPRSSSAGRCWCSSDGSSATGAGNGRS